MDDRPTTRNTASSEAATELRAGSPEKLSSKALIAALEDHKRWLETDHPEGKQADFSDTDVSGHDLTGKDLRRAYLRHTDFHDANLKNANLCGATLNHANLQGAILFGTNLSKTALSLADLSRADLQGADLTEANMNCAQLNEAHVFRADLSGAQLNGACAAKAKLSRADLEGAFLMKADLRGASLAFANLKSAELEGAELQDADLREANLAGAHLNDVDMSGANLAGARLQRCTLEKSDLSAAIGVKSHQLAGSNLTNAKLPDDIKEFSRLDHIEELSRHSRTIFLSTVGACIFSWLTIATTTDAALLTTTASTPLPIIQTKIPTIGFYLAAPALLLALYIYLHLYLQNLWEGLASLPAIFPDGSYVDERAYPWLLTCLIRTNMPMLKQDLQTFHIAKKWLSILAAWCLVPATLLLFWCRYLPTQNFWVLGIQTLMIVAAIWAGLVFYQRASATLSAQTQTAHPFSVRNLVLTAIPVLLFVGAVWATDRGHVFAMNLGSANLQGADLRNLDLRNANLQNANLEGANLHGTNLASANLRGANLEGANIEGANLEGANLAHSHLQEAMFWKRGTKGPDLINARKAACEQLSKAVGLKKTSRPTDLVCGAKITTPPPGT